MTRSVSTWLMVLVPCVLVYAGTARAQYSPPPNAAESPPVIEPLQHAAASSSFDADSLGNRNVYVDGTFAPFSGIYESGVRFRLTGNASWYKFVTSEDPRTGGEPVTALLRGSGA